MAQESPIVALFDVDGTLIRTEGRSRHARVFRAAFQTVYGVECNFLSGMHGMTDRQIFRTLAEHLHLGNGRGTELALEACRTMVKLYSVPDEQDGRYVPLAGAEGALRALADRGVVLGLVTGNAEEIAQDKLSSAGLDAFFSFGAFGTEAEHRNALPPIAMARAEALTGQRVDPRAVFVVGDTPRDVACALENGLRAVAVATGHIPFEELSTSGAELILPDLTDIDPVLRLMGL